ncbi:MAG TPA: hypothetical protein VN039_01155 [Nitrospira sp.]|nr:hypothetical protein [Nitrospira sp.]
MAFVNVSGTVTRTFYQGKGAEVTESFEVKGKEVKKRWTAWFDTEHGLSEGDVVEVSGLHGDEVSEWTDKDDQVRHTVKRSLNKAKLKGEPQGSHVPVQEQEAPAVSGWDAAPDESPF